METSLNEEKTYTDPVTGKFIEGNPGGGRPPETEEQKVIKKARKELIADYKEALAQALPMLSPVLVKKAMGGDVPAIKELHDRVMDKATENVNITLPKPIHDRIFEHVKDEDAISKG